MPPSPWHHVSDLVSITSVTLPLVALTTLPGYVNTEGSSVFLAGQAVPSSFTCPLEQRAQEKPPEWAQMDRPVPLSPKPLNSFPRACTASTCAPSAFYPSLQGRGLLPKSSLIEKIDGESQFGVISLVGQGWWGQGKPRNGAASPSWTMREHWRKGHLN